MNISFPATLRSTLLLLGLLLSNVSLAQDETKEAEVSEPQIVAIAISKIPSESEKVLNLLKSNYKPVIEDSVVKRVAIAVDTLGVRMQEVMDLTQYAIDQNFPADISGSFVTKWEGLIKKIESPLNKVSDYTQKLEKIHNEIITTRKQWNFTESKYESDELASEEARSRINYIVEELSKVEQQLNDSLNKGLDQQNKLIDLKIEAESQMKDQTSFLQKELGTLLSERSVYLWQMKNDTVSSDQNEASNSFYYSYNTSEAERYVDENIEKLLFVIAIFIGFVLLLYLMINKLKEFERFEPSIAALGRGIFKRPIFTALFLSSVAAIPITWGSPIFVALLMIFIILTSFVFLVPVTIPKHFRNAIYIFTLLYIFFLGQDLILLGDSFYRLNQLFLNVALMAFFFWFNRKRKAFGLYESPNTIWLGLLKGIAPLFLIMLVVSLASNIIGYLYLSYLINGTVVRSFFVAIVFGLVYSTFTAVFTLFLYTPLAEMLNLLRMYREWLIKRAKVIFQFLFILFWLRVTLDGLHLLAPALDLLDQVLNFGVDLEDFKLTIGSFVNFAIVIMTAWIISNFIRLLLQDEILSRLEMAKGVPMAIASLTYYVLFVIGLIMALLALGFDITHLSVLAGALGIGIGFGLQNVVNNFISGLILIFERPITVGDIVNLQTVEGTVISIGIRSSKVEKYDGSILIVPNADLISNQVVNYTLTDEKRRFILPIHTDTNVNPEKVLELMTEASASIPDVLSEPGARSYFSGTDEQSRVFKLYFWVSGTAFLKTKSDVTIAVHKLLEENGIQVKTQKELVVKQEKNVD